MRRRRQLLAALSVAGILGAFLLTALADDPGELGGAILFAPFVALLAFEFGVAAGLASAFASIVLYGFAFEIAGSDVTVARIVGRLLPMLVLGGAVGWLNARLRERNLTYEKIVETSAELICTIGADSTITYVNGRSRDVLGFEPEELIGRPVTVVLDGDEARGVAERLAQRRAGFSDSLTYDIRMRHKDGHDVFGLANSSPFYDASGEFVGSLAMVTDITERRRTQEALVERERALEEAQAIAHLGSWSWDTAANHVTWSAELFRIFGRDPQDFDASYEAFLECVHPDDRELVDTAVKEAYASGSSFTFEHRIVRPDGEVRVLEATGVVSRDGAERPVRMTGTAHDITERRRAEGALAAAARARRQATELNDNVVQCLVLAKYALDRGDEATAATMVDATLVEARRMIEDLLGEADVQPGQLRRETAAGVGD